MNLTKLKASCPNLKITENVSMAEYCSFKAGGTASYLAEPIDTEELKAVLRFVNEEAVPFVILGNGSNTLFEDGVYEGIVIKQADSSEEFNLTDIGEDGIVRAGANVLLSSLSRAVSEEPRCYTGMEGLSGIPGSVGGAVYMNAGAYGYEIKDILLSVHAISADGREERDFTAEEADMGYRHSAFMSNGYIITSAVFRLEKDDYAEIRARMADFTERRVKKQPLQYPSAGSTFKRPEGFFAGKLIEDCGLKGLTVGGAQVSPLHAGFVVNLGTATATDILELMALVRNVVSDKFGVTLEPEVRIIRSMQRHEKGCSDR